MKLIEQNPFRILGIAVNASEKEKSGNLGKKKLLEIGKEITFPLDLPAVFPPLNRTAADMDNANTAINLSQDKVRHALFWFAQPKSPIGKLGYERLLEGDTPAAINHFSRGTSWEEKLCLSVLYFQDGQFAEGLLCIADVIDNHCRDFCMAIVGQTYTVTSDDLRQQYLSMLTSEVDALTILKSIRGNVALQSFADQLSRVAVDGPAKAIDSALAAAKAVDDDDAQAQLNAGRELIKATKQPLETIKQLVGQTDSRYSRRADKVADQILQCSINYHNALDNATEDPLPASIIDQCLKLAEYAEKMCVGRLTKERIKKNADILREKKKRLPPDVLERYDIAIKNKINELIREKDQTIDNAINLLKNCATHIVAIKGYPQYHDYYLQISTYLVSIVLDCVIEEHNQITNRYAPILKDSISRSLAINQISRMLKKAWKATLMMDMFDMTSEFKNGRYAQNRKALYDMCESTIGKTEMNKQTVAYDELDLRTEEDVYRGCRTAAQYRYYLNRFPHGKHKQEVKSRYDALIAKEEQKRRERELDEKEFKKCSTISDYKKYLKVYPQGIHKGDAKKIIAERMERWITILSVVIVEIIWVIIGFIIEADNYKIDGWEIILKYLGISIIGWFLYINLIVMAIFSLILSKIFGYEK